ncbi:MAG: RES family NAD+ phosphorylase [Terriglobales bacterium]
MHFSRIYDPTKFGTQALTFRHWGPTSRFDHHRLAAAGPSDDRDRGILYGAPTLSSCLVEVFGDTKIIDVAALELAIIEVSRELKFLDLRGNGAMRAGTVAAICKESNRRYTQEWSRYFYDHGFVYDTVDGIIYGNAHNDEDALALYERSQGSLALMNMRPLSHPVLKDAIMEIALATGMIVVPY